VMGFSELLGRADTDPQRKRYLEMILKSAQRCHKIVQGLLSFARRHQPERKLSNLNDLIEGAVEFLAYQLRTSNVEVLNKISTKLPPTMVDPHQIQQVFLNIINNARQAIEAHQRKGSITLSSEVSGAHVRVILRDDGPGIPEGNLSKVFDPFFTTKEPGKGTGLGLSLCYGIIKEHGGTIVVRSKPGEGATFIIELPVAPDGPTSQNQPEDTDFTHAVPNALEGAGRRILIIDDEEQILQMLKETLSAEGYQVDVAQDGETALECIRHTSYDLALCDWRMPGLNGEQVYERARVFDPELCEKMIFLTGDVINQKVQQFLKDHQKHCLPKPFSLHEFRRAVRGAISSQDGTN